MALSESIRFVKMQGIGNDFVMVDCLRDGVPAHPLPDLARRVSDRKFGVGGDGLILLEKGESTPFRMRMFNPDGSESEMCGNGVRCFAKLVRLHGHSADSEITVETGAGTLTLCLQDSGLVRVDMGLALFTRGEIGMLGQRTERFVDQKLETSQGVFSGTAVSMGNPHLVIFHDDVMQIDLPRVGAELERHPLFPKRVNVHFVQVLDREHLVQRTWERGAGITLACGTGACACGAAALLTSRAEANTDIKLPGGHLKIEVMQDHRVFMTGPAEVVFEGDFEVA